MPYRLIPNALRRGEIVLLAAVLALLAAACFGPYLPQVAGYHGFADQRAIWSVPHGMDVLSNLPFAVMGLLGLWRLHSARSWPGGRAQRGFATLFFAGLLVTAVGSAWYHLQPHDAGLAVDRMAMIFPFAGLLGLAACRISDRAGIALAACVLGFAPLAVYMHVASGNLLPWVVVQGGGMALLLALACLRPREGNLPVAWMAVLTIYLFAKALEAGDHAVWQMTDGWVSGHSLKHAVAALASWPVYTALDRMSESRNVPNE